MQTLADTLDRFQDRRDNLPSSLEDSPTTETLDAVLELRGHVEDLQAIHLPKKASDGTDGAHQRR